MSRDQKWMEKYELLKEYQKEYGNIDVPQSYEVDGVKLGIWLAAQRQAYKGHKSSKLTSVQIKLLEELGINWNFFDKKWMEKYELLKEYQKEYGNIDIPHSYEVGGVKLGIWLHCQRQAYKGHKSSKLTSAQIKLLEELGINWNFFDKKWMEKYELLKEYKEEHGNIDIPQSYEVNGVKLGIWLHCQRQAYKGHKSSKLTSDQIKLLEELGMNWNLRDKTWDDYYNLLKEYQKKYGNIDVPTYYQIDQVNLGVWLHHQRQAYRGQGTGVITQDQIKLLEELGMSWNPRDKKWNDCYNLLKEYQEKYGNIDISYSYEVDGVKLGNWLYCQRQAYRGQGSSVITQAQIKLLEELGMNWNPRDKKWNDYYNLLKEYQEEHGNIDVPQSYEVNGVKLGIWLTTQRHAYKGQEDFKITQYQIKLLEELGINWNPRDKKWNDCYELLKEYQKEYGNIDVPTFYQIDQVNLGSWLHQQRQAYRGKGTNVITQDQIRLLNELGIDWNIKDTKFLQKAIDDQTKEKYQQILLERINHIMDDLVNEGSNEIDSTNQKEFEKIMVKRIWR